MEKTEIKIEFILYHDLNINHQQITEVVGFGPTLMYNKGEQIRKGLYKKESAWIYSIGYIESLYVDDILEVLIQKIEPNILPLTKYIRENRLNSKFNIVLRIADNQPPSHFLSKKFIHFCSQLNAEIDTDIYLL